MDATRRHAGLLASKPAPVGRKERIRRFGVDCCEGLKWHAGWEPGGEYTKTLTIKNVSTKVMKLKYRLPETKFFNMAFPETITLTAGLSKALQVHTQRASPHRARARPPDPCRPPSP